MADVNPKASTQNTQWIKASQESLYRAFIDPKALAAWMAPGDMAGEVHYFELRIGGGYQMSLSYPISDETSRGKTSAKEDHYTARFVELEPPRKIVEAISFDSAAPAFWGVMTMTVRLEADGEGTRVTMLFTDLPPGIQPEDNEAGTQSALEKLARYVGQ